MERSCDVVIVGGGIAGSGLATVLARGGLSVLLLEKSPVFRDQVGGEWLAPWGVVEAKRSGLYHDLCRANDHHITYHVEYGDGLDSGEREAARLDMTAFLPGVPGPLALGHPQACQTLFEAAAEAGASVCRPVEDVDVHPGSQPSVAFTSGGARHEIRCRLIVGADGRGSIVRRQARIELHQDPTHHYFSGLLVEGASDWPVEIQSMGTAGDVQYFVFPRGEGRVRLYLSFANEQKHRFAGPEGPQRFLAAFRLESVPRSEAIASARVAGPCHSIPNQSTWVDTPVAEGVVLVGDAAGYNDPIIGQGLAIAMRDVRTVSEAMMAAPDWSPGAFTGYVEERRERMRRLRFAAAMDSVLHAEFGPGATARKLRIMRASAVDPTLAMARVAGMLGPENVPAAAFSEAAWERFVSA